MRVVDDLIPASNVSRRQITNQVNGNLERHVLPSRAAYATPAKALAEQALTCAEPPAGTADVTSLEPKMGTSLSAGNVADQFFDGICQPGIFQMLALDICVINFRFL